MRAGREDLSAFDAALRAKHGRRALIGVDEAGRGPLAGPVVAAAVMLPERGLEDLSGVRDSKLLSPARRESLYPLIRARALSIGLAWAYPAEIDGRNILNAALRAMGRAAWRAGRMSPEALVVVDGNRPIAGLGRGQVAVVDGDRLSLAVACASVIAKVARDRWMCRLSRRYPDYGFSRHKGYGTPEHLAALLRHGPCPIHRRSFAPVAAASARAAA